MKAREIKEAFDEGYKTGVEAERARVRKMLDQCRGVYEKESWDERRRAQARVSRDQIIGVAPLPIFFTETEKMLTYKGEAIEYAVFVVCEWSVGPDFKEDWMPLRF